MKLVQCRFSSGQRVPLLVQDGPAAPLPILIPFIYVQLKLRHRAYSTATAHLRAIQCWRVRRYRDTPALKPTTPTPD